MIRQTHVVSYKPGMCKAPGEATGRRCLQPCGPSTHPVANDKQPTQYLRDDPCSREAPRVRGCASWTVFWSLKNTSSVQLLMGHICWTWKKKGKWSLGLLLFSPKASFPKAGPSKADQFPKIYETEDSGAKAGARNNCVTHGRRRSWERLLLGEEGCPRGPPAPGRASSGGSYGGSPGRYALCFPRRAFWCPAPPSWHLSGIKEESGASRVGDGG